MNKEPEYAAKLFGAAQALLESMALPLFPAERLDWEREEKRLRAQLPSDKFESAWEEGKTISLEQFFDELIS